MQAMLNAQREKIATARARLRERVGKLPGLGIIAGTGLSHLTDDMEITGRASYADLGFPVSTVAGHPGELVWGKLRERPVFVLRGRFHLYEGYTPEEIAMPVRALAQEGMRRLIITNAAGGLGPKFRVGGVMAICDHINATGQSPLRGPHAPEWGERFPDMSRVWDAEAVKIVSDCAARAGLELYQGIYLGLLGPQLETPAETRVFRNAGASAVGMSTVMEAIAAAQAGVRLAGLSAITNVNNPDAMAETSLEEIVNAAETAAPALRRYIAALAESWK